jgi:hypothetical protein
MAGSKPVKARVYSKLEFEEISDPAQLLSFYTEDGVTQSPLEKVQQCADWDEARALSYTDFMLDFVSSWVGRLFTLRVYEKNTDLWMAPPVHLFPYNRVNTDYMGNVTRIYYAEAPDVRIPESKEELQLMKNNVNFFSKRPALPDPAKPYPPRLHTEPSIQKQVLPVTPAQPRPSTGDSSMDTERPNPWATASASGRRALATTPGYQKGPLHCGKVESSAGRRRTVLRTSAPVRSVRWVVRSVRWESGGYPADNPPD